MQFEDLLGKAKKGNRHLQLEGIKPEEFKHIIDERCCVEPEEFCTIANYRFLNSNYLSSMQTTEKEQLQKMMNEYIVYLSSLLIGLVSKYTYRMSHDEKEIKDCSRTAKREYKRLSINLGEKISQNLLTKNFHNDFIDNQGVLNVFFLKPDETYNKEEKAIYGGLINKLQKYIEKLVEYRDKHLGEFATKIDWLWWLSYGETFGLTDPLTLDLSILKISFALSFKINVASIIGLAFAMFWYIKI